MVRTKGDSAVTKVAGSKAPRKQLVTGGASTSLSSPTPSDPAKKKGPSTGLPYCPQPTPEWQKSVKSFFTFATKPGSEDKENHPKLDDDENVPEIKSSNDKGKGPVKGKKSAKKSSKKSEDNDIEEVERVNKNSDDEIMEEPKSKKSRGKALTKGKRSTKKSSKKSQENSESDNEREEIEPENKNSEESLDQLEESPEQPEEEVEEPVSKKRNRIIESDDDE